MYQFIIFFVSNLFLNAYFEGLLLEIVSTDRLFDLFSTSLFCDFKTMRKQALCFIN